MVFWQPRVTSSKRAYAISSSAAPRACAPVQTTADPYLHRRHSNTVLSCLCGVPGSWCAQGLFEPSEHLWQEYCQYGLDIVKMTVLPNLIFRFNSIPVKSQKVCCHGGQCAQLFASGSSSLQQPAQKHGLQSTVGLLVELLSVESSCEKPGVTDRKIWWSFHSPEQELHLLRLWASVSHVTWGSILLYLAGQAFTVLPAESLVTRTPSSRSSVLYRHSSRIFPKALQRQMSHRWYCPG